ncbi:MAG: hypothetical protein UR69_C0002G0188 [Candidatus Moranbacteria bacterium GW2011_GWE2_35_2-]|nr:MAG: hypothetical protein UR69_C0002G0188 [Candidatus Moranbacteria bacterium GW2011_GWE2_35_2-]KKQ06575.1 MAG: hypothetical protein US15_C0008G0007 [Candidatus Moranbacteria bacterium GW2011_GWF1_36_4]KKQ22463.1 MAG: hypothetical protein US37_C0002G0088 [Candidatus Moranbacteria bacterium GW2011_GWF2_37_11]KKQ29532.1 MAG: hypothetical protein US44_C0001G0124 [Candidatus Moranbacteria bacterium GW2011_GWD1_37_17]KKQ30598.1 MAG: hypothetical protein US47_C0002G0188 [Candidatus Moranbacteria b
MEKSDKNFCNIQDGYLKYLKHKNLLNNDFLEFRENHSDFQPRKNFHRFCIYTLILSLLLTLIAMFLQIKGFLTFRYEYYLLMLIAVLIFIVIKGNLALNRALRVKKDFLQKFSKNQRKEISNMIDYW